MGELGNAVDMDMGAGNPLSSAAAGLSREIISKRLMEERRKGLDIRLVFDMYDKGSTGYISKRDFTDALSQLHLQASEADIARIVYGYSHESNPDMINYIKFLRTHSEVVPPLNLNGTVDSIYGAEYSHRRGAGFSFDEDPSYRRFSVDPSELSPSRANRRRHQYESYESKVDMSRPEPFFGEPASPIHARYTRAAGNVSPTREAARENSVAVWGANTPLSKRGQISKDRKRELQEKGKWMCIICLFENKNKTGKCEVCGAANPKAASSVQLECHACHFQNNEFAEKCEMCGMPLKSSVASVTLRKPSLSLTANQHSGRGWRDEDSVALSDEPKIEAVDHTPIKSNWR